MSERRVEESSQSSVGLAGRVDKSLEQGRNESLDLGVVDDLSELLETGVGGLTDLSAAKLTTDRVGPVSHEIKGR